MKSRQRDLPKEETYAEISPVRLGGNGVTALFRLGGATMCTFCVVPFTRGRRSQPRK